MSAEAAASLHRLQESLRRSLASAGAGKVGRGHRGGPLVAAELSAYSVKAVAAKRRGGVPCIEAVFQDQPPAEVLRDRGATARFLGKALGRFLASHGARDYTLLLTSGEVRTSIIEVPPLPLEESAEAIGVKAAKLLGISSPEWHAGAMPLISPPSADGRDSNPAASSFLVAALPKAEIDQAAEVCRHAGRLPSAVTVPMALYGRLAPRGDASAEGSGEREPVVWVIAEIRRDVSSVAIYCDGVLRYSRSIQLGGAQITAALTDVVATPGGFVELTVDEAEALKRSIGYPAGDEEPAGSRLSAEQIRMMLEPKLKAFVFEIRNSIRHYQQKSGNHRIHRLVLTGGGANLKGLDDYVQESLKIRPQRFEVEALGISPEGHGKEKAEFLSNQGAAMCAALQDRLVPLDLAPPCLRWDRVLRIPCRLASIVSGLAAVVLLVLGMGLRSGLAEQRRAIESLERGEAFSREIESISSDLAALDGEIASLTGGLGLSAPIPEILADISRRLPSGAVLTGLVATDEGETHVIALNGKIPAASGPAVLLVESFGTSPFIREVRLASLTRQTGAEGETIAFTLDLHPHLRPPERRP
jgi:Tfp pilus assembly PilM family ATPase